MMFYEKTNLNGFNFVHGFLGAFAFAQIETIKEGKSGKIHQRSCRHFRQFGFYF